VRAAAEDTERLRRLFVQHVAKPAFTVLHGQSWGGNVAAKGAEMFTEGRPYDVVLLTSGVLAGGSRAYDFRIDLRVVYQALCGNHPAPQDPPYPVWMGLPADSTLTRAELAARAKDCLGVGLKPAQRSPEQARKLATIARVIRIPEDAVLGHLNWATFHFQDIVQHRTGGRNPFTTAGVRYTGSDDDDALNAAVARFSADPAAKAHMVEDTDMSGRVPVPVLTVHAINDPTAFVEMESAYAETMKAGGSGDRLVQVFADYAVHSYLADPIYLAAADALIAWGRGGPKPTPQAVAERCAAVAGPAAAECRIVPGYRPAPLSARVPAR
jgi:alpha-beta hydrolase superfamily lysophospholipase